MSTPLNVVLLGAPSTGKTTLAGRLAADYGTLWMPEYGREYWDAHQVGRRLTLEQLVEIAEGHLEREDRRLERASRFLFTDTNALTTRLFSLYYHGAVHPRLDELARIAERRYDVVLVCDIDIPYDDTWDRSGDVQRYDFQTQVLDDLEARRILYHLLRGDLETRVRQVNEILASERRSAHVAAQKADR